MAAATLAWHTTRWRPLLAWFVPLGRMALTVYLTQSVVQLALFSSHGAGLAGRVSLAWLPAVAVAILLAQRYACDVWLRRHGQGPVEWLWRRASYGTLTSAAAS
jgi:uncharacterized protein